MLAVVSSKSFKKDIRKAEKRGKDVSKLRTLILMLLNGEALPPKYNDHSLKSNWSGYRDAHIEPDWLLIYRIYDDELHLVRTGTHSDIFKE